MGYIRASAQCLCGSPFPSAPPPSPLLGCSSSALRLQTKPHLQEEKGHLSLHLIFFEVLCTLLLPGDHPWCLVTRSEPHVRTSPLGRRSLGVSWMLRANHRDYHSLLSRPRPQTLLGTKSCQALLELGPRAQATWFLPGGAPRQVLERCLLMRSSLGWRLRGAVRRENYNIPERK